MSKALPKHITKDLNDRFPKLMEIDIHQEEEKSEYEANKQNFKLIRKFHFDKFLHPDEEKTLLNEKRLKNEKIIKGRKEDNLIMHAHIIIDIKQTEEKKDAEQDYQVENEVELIRNIKVFDYENNSFSTL